MKTLIPYLTIPTQCEEALTFYKDCFNGTISFLQKYSETDYPVSPAFKNKIAHAEFIAEGIHFYASDGFENSELTVGDNIAMTINFTSEDEQKVTFDKLKANGVVTMTFSKTSANSILAALVDQYGVHWYLNYSSL